MKLGEFEEYKGYKGSICCSNNSYYGKIIDAGYFATYESDDVISLYDEYKKAVDDYIEFKKELHVSRHN